AGRRGHATGGQRQQPPGHGFRRGPAHPATPDTARRTLAGPVTAMHLPRPASSLSLLLLPVLLLGCGGGESRPPDQGAAQTPDPDTGPDQVTAEPAVDALDLGMPPAPAQPAPAAPPMDPQLPDWSCPVGWNTEQIEG